MWHAAAGWLRGAPGPHWDGPSEAGSGGEADGEVAGECPSQEPLPRGLLADLPLPDRRRNLHPSHLRSHPHPISVC